MSKEQIERGDVLYARQRKGFDGVLEALTLLSAEERVRVLTSIAILYGLDGEVLARLRSMR